MVRQREWLWHSWLLAMFGSGLVGGGYGQAWVSMTDLFSRDNQRL
ncbi:hypothetical protein [Levilactobacillus tujiorum]|nr:hypothetical protein [Levilactobacillus tujiorum]